MPPGDGGCRAPFFPASRVSPGTQGGLTRAGCRPARQCWNRFYACADLSGSHQAGAQVFATYVDCECECEGEEAGDAALYDGPARFASRGPAQCTAGECSARFPDYCRDSALSADYVGVPGAPTDRPGLASAATKETGEQNCECACCLPGQCDEPLVRRTTHVESAGGCVPETCGNRFYQCPNAGSHNDGALAFATFLEPRGAAEEAAPEPATQAQVQEEEPAPNCACTCCLPGQCDEPKQYRTYVEDRKDCSVEMCGNRFYGCPNAGSHNDDAVVMAAFGAAAAEAEAEEPAAEAQVQVQEEEPAPNCACTCCLPGQCDEPEQYRTYVEDRKDCSVEMCGNRFYGCPNAGSHNDDAVVTAAFGAAPAAEAQVQEEPVPESRAQAPAAPAPPVNCVCSCCLPDSCANGLRTYETFVNEPADCNPETCGDRFYGCPDATGSHNDRAEAFASFVDCSCGCDDERGGAVYAEPKRFQSLGPKRCNPDRCDKEFPGFCARAGYMTTAAFTGVEEAEADCDCTCCPAGDTCSSEPYGMAAGRASLCTKQACSERLARCDIRFDVITARYRGVETVELPGGLSPAAAGGIAAAVIVVAAAIIGAALTYSYVAIKRRRGYAWVLHEHEENTSHMVKTDLGDDGPPSEESSPVAQP